MSAADATPAPVEANRGVLLVVSAPSGAGKSSLTRALVAAEPRAMLSISHTTRAARPGETDGVEYHFVTDAAFRELIADGVFLEHAQVFDHRYGTSAAAVRAALERGNDVLLEIDWQGARQVRKRFPESVTVFILPPSIETLRARLESRGQDAPEVIERRLREAADEIVHHDEFDYLVVNADFDTALGDLGAILRAARLAGPHQREALGGLLAGFLA